MLDVRAMHAGGGSVVIEAREPRAGFGYLVHWAGGPSSNDGADCGTSADLLINIEDIELLAMAAGGYGLVSYGWRGIKGLGRDTAEQQAIDQGTQS